MFIFVSLRKHQLCFVGVGKPLIPERCRMLLAGDQCLSQRIQWHFLETLKQVIEVFNGNTMDPQMTLHAGWVGTTGRLD